MSLQETIEDKERIGLQMKLGFPSFSIKSREKNLGRILGSWAVQVVLGRMRRRLVVVGLGLKSLLGYLGFCQEDEDIFSSATIGSIVSSYWDLEIGKVFNCEVSVKFLGVTGWHVGFMLSHYDVDLSYDSHKDTFQARYPPHGRRAATIEIRVIWDRLRTPHFDTSPHDLHISNCWWYGVVDHLEACDRNDNYCHCYERS
ncbi:hypothetical protein L6452_13598 [Arctium lappa]|uniref:Uncharacterized protein n=1 Tax=Arctium lappa TaxID=4217 RepID=A0ACB9CIZ1_ARCLA|nr:hypothetical protein L6452_13598 [Arctium lappa]